MYEFESIIVKARRKRRVKIIENPTNYKFIGKGLQGAVFKLSPERCVKIYPNPKHKITEENVLRHAQGSTFFPKIFETGPNFIIMEFINGYPLDKYLEKEENLPLWLTAQILLLLKEMKKLKLARCDAGAQHIIVLEKEKSIKLIDHVNTGIKYVPHPRTLFKNLKRLGVLPQFLQQVKELDREIYDEWKVSLVKYFS